MLVKFDYATRKLNKIKDEYKVIVKDITKRIGNGMTDCAKNTNNNPRREENIMYYELYCRYVAGPVGEGVTRLFVNAKLANRALLQRPETMESMGRVLQ